MKNIKPLIIIVIILMAVNCALIAVLWINNYKKLRPTAPIAMPKGPAFEYLSHELKLTPEQVKQYDAMRKAHFDLTQRVNSEQRLQRDSFFDNLKKPDAKPADIDAMEKRILANQNRMDTATLNHFRRLRSLLKPAQQLKFDSVITNALRMMSKPHPPGSGQGMHPGNGPQGGFPPDMRQGGPQRKNPHGKPGEGPPPDGKPQGQHGRPGGGPPSNGGPPPGWPPPGTPPPHGGPPPGVHPPNGGPPPDGPPPYSGPPPQSGNDN